MTKFVLFILFLLLTCLKVTSADGPLTLDQFRCMFPRLSNSRLTTLLPHLNNALNDWNINNVNRIISFLAHVSLATNGLQTFEESDENNPWCHHYEGGCAFRGRGALMLRGRSIYSLASDFFGADFESNPSQMRFMQWAFQTAGWWWNRHQLNFLADLSDFAGIARELNNGASNPIDFSESRQLALEFRRCLNPV
jgi:predicted chitinase